ncbi:uncharacterized protein AB9W97_001288 isoform 2-T6 [Spinachia spinachia]
MAETGQGDVASNEEESSVQMSNNNAIERGANLSEVVQTDGTHKEKSSVEMSNNSPIKRARGRPKGSTKCKSGSLTSGENGGSSVMRRNPRRSSDKKPLLDTVGSNKEGEDAEKRPRGRGRPKKIKQETGGSPPAKKRLGRPKGSLNKKRPAYKVSQLKRSPPKPWTRGRPRKPKAKRGRPRKYPLPKELKKPRVWKPLGRPRKYSRADPAEGSEPAPRRSRGRPHKSQSKKGAHLPKTLPESLPSPSDPNVEPQRKRGRPPSAPKSDAAPTRKRGRPKGSVNTNKAEGGTPIDSADGNHSTAERDSPLVALKCDTEEVAIKDETPINQDADSEVSNQV